MGSRARTAAAACLVAGGMWAGSTGAPTALADPADSADVTAGGVADGRTDHRTNKPSRAKGKQARTETKTETKTETDSETPDEAAPDAGDAESADENTTGQNATAAAREDPPPSCEGGGKDCGPGWPWPWPWPWSDDPDPPGAPNPAGGGSSSDRPVGVPRPGGPPSPGTGAPVGRPPEDLPFDPDVIDTIPGVGLPAAGEAAPISVPVLTMPVAAGTGGAATAASAGPGAGIPVAPRQALGEPPPARRPPPAPETAPGPRVAPPGRIGYRETLRSAGTSQLAALAIPGVVGILVLTALGGLLGYRQARAGQAMRAHGTARFMN
ncbi:hypothetical protein MJO55_26135 [Mycolicibacterium rufum]|uniref:Uncharacterized protein n=1 Tax=Mycolicibacterium rufum TaxID=318424 RepID=A0ABY3UAH5_9MYCO|nr:hypothetical protein [Mycolicibacterium rufum]ULP36612.1 hypothetical protein MJO55_26135 [Mycolicibacterium rufum]